MFSNQIWQQKSSEIVGIYMLFWDNFFGQIWVHVACLGADVDAIVVNNVYIYWLGLSTQCLGMLEPYLGDHNSFLFGYGLDMDQGKTPVGIFHSSVKSQYYLQYWKSYLHGLPIFNLD